MSHVYLTPIAVTRQIVGEPKRGFRYLLKHGRLIYRWIPCTLLSTATKYEPHIYIWPPVKDKGSDYLKKFDHPKFSSVTD